MNKKTSAMKTKSSIYFISEEDKYFKNKYLFDDYELNKKEWVLKKISLRTKL